VPESLKKTSTFIVTQNPHFAAFAETKRTRTTVPFGVTLKAEEIDRPAAEVVSE
jgi:hypothetical protein